MGQICVNLLLKMYIFFDSPKPLPFYTVEMLSLLPYDRGSQLQSVNLEEEKSYTSIITNEEHFALCSTLNADNKPQ